MKDALKDPRTKKLMRELARRLPGTTLVTRRWHDEPDSGEVIVEVLNAPATPRRFVESISRPLIWKLWGDGPHPVYVVGIDAESTAKYRADALARSLTAPIASAARRRRVRSRPRAAPRKRTAAR
jgi:hypothetical protein